MEKDLMTRFLPITRQQIIEQAKKEIELCVERVKTVQLQISALNASIAMYGSENRDRVLKRMRSLWVDLRAAMKALKAQRAALEALRGKV